MKRQPGLVFLVSVLVLQNATQTIAQSRSKIAEVSRGTIELKRGGGDYRPVSVGTDLFVGDLIKAQQGSRAEIRCTVNGTVWTVPNDDRPWGVANVCPARNNRSSFFFR